MDQLKERFKKEIEDYIKQVCWRGGIGKIMQQKGINEGKKKKGRIGREKKTLGLEVV